MFLFSVRATPPSTSKRPVIAIAGLLGGKTLVPLAQSAAGRRVRTWPQPDEEVQRAFHSVRDFPPAWFPIKGGVPTRWYLWTEDLYGVPVRTGIPVLGEAHCQAVWGLSTQLQPIDHETTAIATNIPIGFQPFNRFTVGAEADEGFKTFLRKEFDKAEVAEFRSKRTDAARLLAHPQTREPVFEVSCAPVEKDSVELCTYRASQGLETRPYKELPDCDEFTAVEGWYLKSADTWTPLKARATLTDCVWKEVRTTTALLLIAVDAKRFVLTREHGYEDESFVIYEVSGNQLKRVLEVAGGGC